MRGSHDCVSARRRDMGAVFRVLLYLYPQKHRELLGAEMQAVFEQGAQEHRLLGPSQYLCFVLLEVGGLILHAAIAQFAKATHRGYLGNQVHGTLDPPQDLPDEVIEARIALRSTSINFCSPSLTINLFRHVSTRARSVRHARTCARCKRSMASGTLNLCADGESPSEWTISRQTGERRDKPACCRG